MFSLFEERKHEENAQKAWWQKNPFLNTQPNRYCGTKERSLGDFRRTY